jgi:hypothetical protein
MIPHPAARIEKGSKAMPDPNKLARLRLLAAILETGDVFSEGYAAAAAAALGPDADASPAPGGGPSPEPASARGTA